MLQCVLTGPLMCERGVRARLTGAEERANSGQTAQARSASETPNTEPEPLLGRVAYLCLQATRQGQASFAHVHEIIAGLQARGWSVELEQPPYSAEGSRLPGALGRALEFSRVQRRFKNVARQADAIYIRAHFAAWPTARWAHKRGTPVVQEINGPYADVFLAWPWMRLLSRPVLALIRWQYRHADALIAVTPQLARWLQSEIGRDDISVIPNGANTDLFRPDAPRPSHLPERYVVFVGALAVWQGIDIAIAAAKLAEWPTDVSLVIAGDGAVRGDVENAASAEERVVYLGVIPYAEVPGVLANSVAGLSPQSSVGGRGQTGLSPLKLYEMASCAAPVIVSDYPGLREFVAEHDCGLVVAPNDPQKLAEAVARLAADSDEASAMGTRGRAAVTSLHSWDARADATSKVLEGVLGREGVSS